MMTLDTGSLQLERLIAACIQHARFYGQETEADALSRTLDAMHTRPGAHVGDSQPIHH